MNGQLSHMEASLEAIESGDFRRIVHKMELERIKYTINHYLRSRLQKIEQFGSFLLAEDENRELDKKRLSSHEKEFAEAYTNLMENHFKQMIFRHIPPQQEEKERRVVRPNLMSDVFIRINSPCGTLINSNDEEVNLTEPDSLYMLPFQLIYELLNKEDISLI
jgi:hypothetical protein